MRFIFLILLTVFQTFTTNLFGQSPIPVTVQSEFSLITCTPGNQIYNRFGHSALRFKDAKQGIDIVFNYGTFDFDAPGFVLKFIQRKLLYTLSVNDYKPFESVYIYEKRGVYEQKLNLDSIEKTKLLDYLLWNYKTENRSYLYDFFYDNCSNRILSVLEKSLGKIQFEKESTDPKSFRSLLDPYINNDAWLGFGIDLILGMEADKIANSEMEMFLPDYLSKNLSLATFKGKTIFASGEWILEQKLSKKMQVKATDPIIVFNLLLIMSLLLLIKRKQYPVVYKYFRFGLLLLAGLAGLFLSFMWWGTDHIATQNNINIVWLNPLFVIFVFLHNSTIKKYLSFALITIILFHSFMRIFLPVQELSMGFLPLLLSILLMLIEFKTNNNE